MARQMGRVLRMSPRDEITLLDNSGKEFRVRLTSFGGNTVEGAIVSIEEGVGESPVKVTLYQGTLKGENSSGCCRKALSWGQRPSCRSSVSAPYLRNRTAGNVTVTSVGAGSLLRQQNNREGADSPSWCSP